VFEHYGEVVHDVLLALLLNSEYLSSWIE
jgi:hypothetical protein